MNGGDRGLFAIQTLNKSFFYFTKLYNQSYVVKKNFMCLDMTIVDKD